MKTIETENFAVNWDEEDEWVQVMAKNDFDSDGLVFELTAHLGELVQLLSDLEDTLGLNI